jgi:hypothetical protein
MRNNNVLYIKQSLIMPFIGFTQVFSTLEELVNIDGVNIEHAIHALA